ncbi:gfo/Idh/MocA family oxidoreductase, partial [Streptomyces sp. NPDC059037]
MHDENATPAPDESAEGHTSSDGHSRRTVLRTAGLAGAGLGLGAFTGGTAQADTPQGATAAAAQAPPRQGHTKVGLPIERRTTVPVGI